MPGRRRPRSPASPGRPPGASSGFRGRTRPFSSGTVARALAEGRATIVSNLGSFAEIPRDVALKVEVDGDQASELADHLSRLAEDPVLRASFEERARTFARSVLDPRRCARLYVEVAQEAASRATRAPRPIAS